MKYLCPNLFPRLGLLKSFAFIFLILSLSAVYVCAENSDGQKKIKTTNSFEENLKSVSNDSDVEVWDPIEPVNRSIFWFNDTVDTYVFEPVASGYDYIVPDPVEGSITNFFRNLAFPVHLLSDVIRLDFTEAGVHTGRFLVNSTVGVAGLFDVGAELGLPHKEGDFASALGYQGVGDGPYLMLPFLGPSNLRDAFGTAVDSFVDLSNVAAYSDMKTSEKLIVTTALNGLRVINRRSANLENIESAKKASLDYYLFVRTAYKQYRDGLIYEKEIQSDQEDAIIEEDGEFLPEGELQ
jgi:phospholipid-binding lipoprotein MlaA